MPQALRPTWFHKAGGLRQILTITPPLVWFSSSGPLCCTVWALYKSAGQGWRFGARVESIGWCQSLCLGAGMSAKGVLCSNSLKDALWSQGGLPISHIYHPLGLETLLLYPRPSVTASGIQSQTFWGGDLCSLEGWAQHPSLIISYLNNLFLPLLEPIILWGFCLL